MTPAKLAARRAAFMLAARGLTAWDTALEMSRHGTPGMRWAGMSKGSMADAYARGDAYGQRVLEGVLEALRARERPPKKPK